MASLDFKGKQLIYAHHLTVAHRNLDPVPEKSVAADPDAVGQDAENLIIHGDNLHALKALLPRYAGRVKCVYIDPPYNTGNEKWVYNDNVNSPLMQQWFKKHVDREDLERHDKWLCMMWPRLHLLRELLSEDGVIFVSIDDNEQARLRLLMDEVFGEDQFIAAVVWKSRHAPPWARTLGTNHQYVLVYGCEASLNLRPRPEGSGGFNNPDDDPRGEWRLDPLDGGNTKGGRWVDSLYFPITNPSTGEKHYPKGNWVHNADTIQTMIAEGRILFGKDGKGRPMRKKFRYEVKDGITWPTIWETDKHCSFVTTADATKELAVIFDNNAVFDTPKPTGLLKRVIKMSTDSDAIILDSFAGSGTTAHAVLALNKEDGGNRRFILVECEEYADRITAERVRRVIKGVPSAKDKALQEGLGGSFTYCELGEPIGIERMLSGGSLPSFESLARYLIYTALGVSAEGALQSQNEDGLFYQDGGTDYYLLYKPDQEYLRSNDAMLDKDRAERIQKAERKAVLFAPGKFIGQRELTKMRIAFCQLPYEIHRV